MIIDSHHESCAPLPKAHGAMRAKNLLSWNPPGFLFQADGARACGSKGQAAKLPGGVTDREEPDCG